jgi:hypothetical protein
MFWPINSIGAIRGVIHPTAVDCAVKGQSDVRGLAGRRGIGHRERAGWWRGRRGGTKDAGWLVVSSWP